MSEYWKSTPKYWCKHCKTYIRDTKLEKTNHEATPKHQGNLKRFLRDLHRGHEKDEKDKERAKSEVARLNGLVSSGPGEGSSSSSTSGFGRGPTPSIRKPQATEGQRKQQLAQLAEMGISIPDEFRPDMAMAGQWQVTSEKIIEPDGEKKPEAIALGVRKRELGEEEEELAEAKKRRWGSTYKTQPVEEDEEALDALLSNSIRKKEEPKIKAEYNVENGGMQSLVALGASDALASSHKMEVLTATGIKAEPSESIEIPANVIPVSEASAREVKEEVAVPGIVFKKRKAKNIRHK